MPVALCVCLPLSVRMLEPQPCAHVRLPVYWSGCICVTLCVSVPACVCLHVCFCLHLHVSPCVYGFCNFISGCGVSCECVHVFCVWGLWVPACVSESGQIGTWQRQPDCTHWNPYRFVHLAWLEGKAIGEQCNKLLRLLLTQDYTFRESTRRTGKNGGL